MGMIGNLIRVSNDELNQFKQNSELLEEKVYSDDSCDQEWYLDLDKSWEAIHYLMNGKSVAETEMEESQPINLVELKSNYNGYEMNQKGVYPEIWDEPESKDFLFDSFSELIEFYKKAANRGEAIITFIS